MLLFLILLIIVNASIFLILFYELKEAKEKAANNLNRLKNFEKLITGTDSHCSSMISLGLLLGLPAYELSNGVIPKFKNVCDKNNDYFNTKIKALENYLKVEYIDEKKIVNGREEETFKGYRHKAKK